MKSTYVDGMMAYVVDNKLHTHWDQVAAATGKSLAAFYSNMPCVCNYRMYLVLFILSTLIE